METESQRGRPIKEGTAKHNRVIVLLNDLQYKRVVSLAGEIGTISSVVRMLIDKGFEALSKGGK